MGFLYHYGSTQGYLSILQSKSIRLCDILKSNDKNELILFYPDILNMVLAAYRSQPFPFRHDDMENEDALRRLIEITRAIIDRELTDGSFSNFVACFSEQADLLSQWRGYANDGKGLCIGFSRDVLEKMSHDDNSIFRLEKVKYISENDRLQILHEEASHIIKLLYYLRDWIVENITQDDNSSDTDNLMGYYLFLFIKGFLIDSLRYKHAGFGEEREWRLFLKNQAYKNPNWVLGNNQQMTGLNGFAETIEYLRNRIEFRITDDNIIPFVPVKFTEFPEIPVKEVWFGPKNKISKGDMVLFLAQNGYSQIEIKHSSTSYR